jgi:hypothetical protein
MATYAFPEAVELEEIEQKFLPRLTANGPFFENFEFEGTEYSDIRWDQEDNYIGLMGIRGYGGKPNRVIRANYKTYSAQPGVYGEFIALEEEELTRRRRAASFNTLIPVYDMVAKCQEQLLTRRINIQEKILADLVITGTYSVTDVGGSVLKTDSYTPVTSSVSTPWSTHSTSTPIQDIRTVQLLSLGLSVDFGAEATLWMNRVTANHMLANTNTNDLGGRRLTGLHPANSLPDINMILAGEDLPQIKVYEGGYYPDGGGSFTRFIPTGKAVLFGKRLSGAKIGSFMYTLNRQSPGGAPKPYTRVIDHSGTEIPGSIEVHDGFNGGPTVKFPSAMVVMTNLT